MIDGTLTKNQRRGNAAPARGDCHQRLDHQSRPMADRCLLERRTAAVVDLREGWLDLREGVGADLREGQGRICVTEYTDY